MIISFEGGEGSGKSTAAKRLAEYLGWPYYREPGSTALGESLRQILVAPKQTPASAMVEMLLMSAARAQLCAQHLSSGQPAVLDRFFDSTLVYQVLASSDRSLKLDQVYQLQTQIVGPNLIPRRTYWIDVDPAIGLQRSLRPGNTEVGFEQRGLEFHQRVRQGYHQLWQKFPQRIHRLDSSSLNADQIFESILADGRHQGIFM